MITGERWSTAAS